MPYVFIFNPRGVMKEFVVGLDEGGKLGEGNVVDGGEWEEANIFEVGIGGGR